MKDSKNSLILITESQPEYELLDTGDGKKLERFGSFLVSRPDPQALWQPALADSEWKKIDASFEVGDGRTGSWKKKTDMPEKWNIDYSGLKLVIKPTPFKHMGLFPEQEVQWMWMKEQIEKRIDDQVFGEDKKIEVLNLFGYTGGATISCAMSGANVTHVDASKAAIAWAKENAVLSGLGVKKEGGKENNKTDSIRWMLDDALEFVQKEVRRGKKYDAILMDPPAFGRSPTGKTWKIEKQLPELLDLCFKLLSDNPVFFLVNGYAAGYSPLAYENIILPLKDSLGGKIESGELSIKDRSARLLSCGIFARWSK